MSKGIVRKIVAPLLLHTFTGVYVVKMYSSIVGSAYLRLFFTDDGAVHVMDNDGEVTQVAAPETLSGDPHDIYCTTWNAETVYVIDSKGYFKYTTTGGFALVSNAVKGSWITIWQGRVIVASDSILQYSGPEKPEGFTEGEGGGFLDVRESFPSLKYRIAAVVSYIDSLLIYGDSATFMLTGSTISNDPSQWYLTEVNNTIGVRAANSVVAYSQNHYFYNEKGMYVATASQSQKFDYKINLSMMNIEDLPALYLKSTILFSILFRLPGTRLLLEI